MAVSNTISTTVYNTGNVIDTAFRRCRVPSQEITGEMIQIAKDALYLLLSSMPQIGMQLWAVDKIIVAFIQGQAAYPLPLGTVDLADKNACTLRQTDYYQGGTTSVRLGGLVRDFGSDDPNLVSTCGVIFTVGGTYNLVFEFSNDNATYTTAYTGLSQVFESGKLYWFDMDPVQSAQFFAVRDATDASMAIDTFYTTGNPWEIPMSRQSQYDYLSLPQKTYQGRPIQIWFDRQREVPVVYVWPTPDSGNTMKQMVISRKRQIMDVGTLTETLDIPQRWYSCVISCLAYYVAQECPVVKPEMIPQLQDRMQHDLMLAQGEERDDSPIRMYPMIGGYTR